MRSTVSKQDALPQLEEEKENGNDREYIAGLEKGIAVLELFSNQYPKLAPIQAAQLAGLPRATARRCLRTLEKLGYLSFDGKYYSMTPRVLRLGHAYFDTTQLAKVAQPVLETLAQRTGEAASVALLDGADCVFIARAATGTSFNGWIAVGARVSAYNTAAGRVLLASRPPEELDRLLVESPPRSLTPQSVLDPAALRKIIAQVRAQGYALCDEEVQIGSRSIAVPVHDRSGNVIAAMCLATYTSRATTDDIEGRLLPALDAGRRMLLAAL